MSLVKRLALNEKGRDFVVGDIHGDFERLQRLLAAVDFQPREDRLIAAGDLVDRGPDSDAVLGWLDRPFFHSVIGNHELMCIATQEGIGDLQAHMTHGGAWFATLSPEEQADYSGAFSTLPAAIEVETRLGPVGVVHAEVPAGLSWQQFTSLLARHDRDAVWAATWGRDVVDRALRGGPIAEVAGLRRLYCGHTPVRQPLGAANISWIDTGACFGGMLSMVDLSVEKIYSL